jgi:hypothetical protein
MILGVHAEYACTVVLQQSILDRVQLVDIEREEEKRVVEAVTFWP